MFWLKRTALAACCMAAAGGLCAFDLQYGSFFKIDSVSVQDSRPVLPLSRGKYANLRVLNRETFELLKSCPARCRQEAASAEPEVSEIRAAKTRKGMWIADVSFGGRWLVTFLIFQNKDGYGVKEPEHFVFLDQRLKRDVQNLLSRAAAQSAAQEAFARTEEE